MLLVDKTTQLRSWIESTLGGRIVEWRQQGGRESGGRPAWFATVHAGGESISCYIRGDRGLVPVPSRTHPLDREFRLLRELNKMDILVPRVFGLCQDPKAILMECVPGDNDFGKVQDQAQRNALATHFVEQLARIHSIDAGAFEAIGFQRPTSAEGFVLDDLDRWERAHHRGLREPVPLVTFACQWLKRNIPAAPARPVLCQGDTGPGNFLFQGGRVTAIVDWEFAHLADPMEDLALIRPRDFYYPTGDLRGWFERYQAMSGTEIDFAKLRYYSVKAFLITPLGLATVVQNIRSGTDHAEWIAQDVVYKRATMEVLADAIGAPLEEATLPDFPETRHSSLFDVARRDLESEQLARITDSYQAHRLRMTLRLLEHLRNVERKAGELDEQELEDMSAILGRRPKTRSEGVRQLETFVLSAGPEEDIRLVQYFYRHAVREQALMKGALGLGETATVSPIGSPAT